MIYFFNRSTLILFAIFLCTIVFVNANSQLAFGQEERPPVEVGVYVVRQEPLILTTELPGRTSAFLIAEVRPQVSGIVQARLYTEGSEVKAGQVLYQIDPASYQAVYDSAKANLARAVANLNAAKPKAKRYKELLQSKAISNQDYDDVMSAYNQSEAEVGVAKAALESAKINLSYTKITAPISGRTGKSEVTAGALVTANQTNALVTIQKIDPIYVDITQASTAMLRLKRALASGKLVSVADNAQKAKVRLLYEDGTPYEHEGTLQFSDVTVDPASSAITLRAIFPNPNQDLLPGMYVRAILEEGTDEKAILAPQQGINRDNKGNSIALVVNKQGVVEARMLKILKNIGNRSVVSEGLNDGDQLIVEGFQKVRPGAKAIAVPASDAVYKAMQKK
ncbi:efflux RND transporter periplasmic adaptor subunit [Desulfovibrio litoralis]|uniref:Membrane fusion protein, multidrug efflux system n=1 Tax=Desulfovibrio litoralis DSM 11393 TaxID=1121455 RepID=A0A1M7T6L3_9BACT|nr:efflux RND transporter periplasmic adaptor subunit [Desulfovibrio litoralis]SHN66347.1 membrane fusion protein, multidrug efflux system [Desulfovibrio litoralis DSM 11393]